MQRYGNSKKIPNFFVEFLLCLTIFNTMETNTTLKDRLQMILEMTGLSIAAFERKLGWSNGSFSKISDTLSFGRVKTIVDTFGINRDWLIKSAPCRNCKTCLDGRATAFPIQHKVEVG